MGLGIHWRAGQNKHAKQNGLIRYAWLAADSDSAKDQDGFFHFKVLACPQRSREGLGQDCCVHLSYMFGFYFFKNQLAVNLNQTCNAIVVAVATLTRVMASGGRGSQAIHLAEGVKYLHFILKIVSILNYIIMNLNGSWNVGRPSPSAVSPQHDIGACVSKLIWVVVLRLQRCNLCLHFLALSVLVYRLTDFL